MPLRSSVLGVPPSTIQETVDLTMQAFELADKYRNPVIILGDGMLGQMMEPVEFPDVEVGPPMEASDWALTGCEGREPRLVTSLALDPVEHLNLMPEGAISLRIHSVGGWGAITTGKNLAMTLFDLLGFDIKANPKYGSEKKGQPTTYYLSAAPEPIRLNCEYHYVDVVMSPDPNVFSHSNPLAGLKHGGVFIIQSSLEDAAAVWASFPRHARQQIIDNELRVFFLDGFRIAHDEAARRPLHAPSPRGPGPGRHHHRRTRRWRGQAEVHAVGLRAGRTH